LNAVTNEQSKQWMHTDSPNKPKTFSALQKADGDYFLGQEGTADGEIHAKENQNNVRIVL
jgi:hypothetical protein